MDQPLLARMAMGLRTIAPDRQFYSDVSTRLMEALRGGLRDVFPDGAGPIVGRHFGVPVDPNYRSKMTDLGLAGLTVYHGSPHKFPPVRELMMPDGTKVFQLMNDAVPNGAKVLAEHPLGKFDMSKIGTGEGAQAYGHGLYFAENPATGTIYREMLAGPKLSPEELAKQIKYARGRAAATDNPAAKEGYLNAVKELTEGQGNQGHLYKVDLPDDQIAKMLDWDKPLSQQPSELRPLLKDVENAGAFAAEKIKVLAQQPGLADWAKRDLMSDAAQLATSKSPQHVSGVLKRMQLDYGISPDSGPFKNVAKDFLDFVKGMQSVPNMDTGGGAISYLQARYGQEAAAKMLREAGIPGIRYLDQGSRAGGKGTSNFVVFDDTLPKIIGRE